MEVCGGWLFLLIVRRQYIEGETIKNSRDLTIKIFTEGVVKIFKAHINQIRFTFGQNFFYMCRYISNDMSGVTVLEQHVLSLFNIERQNLNQKVE